MILFIITDSPANARGGGFWTMKHTLEDLAGDVCVPLRYDQLTRERVAALKPWAICHSGGSAIFSEYDILQHPLYRWLVTAYDAPQIGFCGGHQLIAALFGGTLAHMGRVKPGEADHNPGYHAGFFKEWGVYPAAPRLFGRRVLFFSAPSEQPISPVFPRPLPATRACRAAIDLPSCG